MGFYFLSIVKLLNALKVKKKTFAFSPRLFLYFHLIFFLLILTRINGRFVFYIRINIFKKLLTRALHVLARDCWLPTSSIVAALLDDQTTTSRGHLIRLSIPFISGQNVLSINIQFGNDNPSFLFFHFSLFLGFCTEPPRVLEQPLNCFSLNLVFVILIPNFVSQAFL